MNISGTKVGKLEEMTFGTCAGNCGEKGLQAGEQREAIRDTSLTVTYVLPTDLTLL